MWNAGFKIWEMVDDEINSQEYHWCEMLASHTMRNDEIKSIESDWLKNISSNQNHKWQNPFYLHTKSTCSIHLHCVGLRFWCENIPVDFWSDVSIPQHVITFARCSDGHSYMDKPWIKSPQLHWFRRQQIKQTNILCSIFKDSITGFPVIFNHKIQGFVQV